VHKMVGKHWPKLLPVNVFCSEFYTVLQFGTFISFGSFKQYICLQLTSIEQGQDKEKNSLIMIKSKLIYQPKQPGAPDGLSELCDYWSKKELIADGSAEPNAALDAKLQNSGPGIDKTCMLLTAGKVLMPDNLPNQFGDLQAKMGTDMVITELPDVVLRDPRPNPTFPPPESIWKPKYVQNATTNQTVNGTEPFAFELADRRIFEKIPPDAWVVVGGVVLFVIAKLIRKKQKQRKRRKAMLAGLAEDVDAMQNMAKASKLSAAEYKMIYDEAKDKVNAMDFSKYEKRKKRKQKWHDLEEKEAMQEKRKRLREIAAEQSYDDLIGGSAVVDADNELDAIMASSEEEEDFEKLFESESTQSSYTHELERELDQFTENKK